MIGIDADSLTEPAAWSNEAIGVAATEVIRRVNLRLDGRLNQREQDWVIKRTVVRMLAARTEQSRAALPPDDFAWAVEQSDQMIASLDKRGYDVIGALDDLRPVPRDGGRRPDDASVEELLEAALDALSLLAEKSAKLWWEGKRESIETVRERGGMADRARGAVFASQRKAVQIADRNPLAAKALGVAVKARDRLTRQSRPKK